MMKRAIIEDDGSAESVKLKFNSKQELHRTNPRVIFGARNIRDKQNTAGKEVFDIYTKINQRNGDYIDFDFTFEIKGDRYKEIKLEVNSRIITEHHDSFQWALTRECKLEDHPINDYYDDIKNINFQALTKIPGMDKVFGIIESNFSDNIMIVQKIIQKFENDSHGFDTFLVKVQYQLNDFLEKNDSNDFVKSERDKIRPVA